MGTMGHDLGIAVVPYFLSPQSYIREWMQNISYIQIYTYSKFYIWKREFYIRRNLAAGLDRCLVLANRPQGEIYVAWYAHTRTGRVAAIRISPTQTTMEDDGKGSEPFLGPQEISDFAPAPSSA